MLSTASLSSCAAEVSSPQSGRLATLTVLPPPVESVYQRVNGVIVFIADNPVRPVHSNENPWLSKWYSQNSNVFVADTHSLWSKTDRKMSRRYGKVERSPAITLNAMLMRHRHEVFAWIAERTGLQLQVEERTKEAGDLIMSLENPDVQDGLTEADG